MGKKLVIPGADFSRVAIVDLPSGYERIRAIRTSRTQWIDTGVNAESGVKVIMDVSGYKWNEGYSSWLFGARHMVGTSTYSFGVLADKDRHGYRFDSGTTLGTQIIYQNVNGRVDFYNDGKTGKAGDYSLELGVTPFNLGVNIFLFSTQKDGTPDAAACAVDCYGARIYSGDNIVRNFIPCKRISDDVIGLYDIVGDEFYGNEGTGVFVAVE